MYPIIHYLRKIDQMSDRRILGGNRSTYLSIAEEGRSATEERDIIGGGRHLLGNHHHKDGHGEQRVDAERKFLSPLRTGRGRREESESGTGTTKLTRMKYPVTATRVITDVGITRLTM